MHSHSFDDRPEVPLGLGYALAMNSDALKVFSDLSAERQRQIIEDSRSVVSKVEMRRFVENLNDSENNI